MNKNQFESLFGSIDFIASLLVALAVCFLIPDKIKLSVTKDIFEVAIAVLSIVFSIYFAALAVIITSGENDFISFLEEDGSYTHIVWTFKVTLLLLFLALIISIVLYVIVLPDYEVATNIKWFPGWGFAFFSFISSWSLFAAALSTLDSIKYAEFRMRYIILMRDQEKKD